MRKEVLAAVLALFLMGSLTLALTIQQARPAPRTWTVDDNGPADFNTMQAAINAASAGDAISVKNGLYHENVDVNKTITLTGESRNQTVIDGLENGKDTMTVTANNVTVTGFTIQGSNNYGLMVSGSKNSSIHGNLIKDNLYGFFVKLSSSIDVHNNGVANNTVGIQINNSTESVLRNNIIAGNKYNFGVWGTQLSSFIHDIDTSNTVDGRPICYMVSQQNKNVPANAGFVAVVNSTNISVANLILTKNSVGVLLAFSSESKIQNVSVVGNEYGLELAYSGRNTASKNTIAQSGHGILLYYARNNTISRNVLTNNSYGIELQTSDSNVIVQNFIEDGAFGISISEGQENVINENALEDIRGGKAIALAGTNATVVGNTMKSSDLGLSVSNYPGSTYTIYHNNFMNNTRQVELLNQPSTIWDNGYPSGGNYWSDYAGKDLDSDDIGDTPYVIDANNRDRYPLMNPYLIDTVPPTLSVLFPENQTYSARNVSLTFTVSEQTSWIGYSLDGQLNATVAGNTTLHGVPDGPHSLRVYARDMFGNMNASETVYFTTRTQPSDGQPFGSLPILIIVVVIVVIIIIITFFVYFRRLRKTNVRSKHSLT